MIIKPKVRKCKECDHYYEDVLFDGETEEETLIPQCELGRHPREKRLCDRYKKSFEYSKKEAKQETCKGCHKLRTCTDKVDATLLGSDEKVFFPGIMCDRYS